MICPNATDPTPLIGWPNLPSPCPAAALPQPIMHSPPSSLLHTAEHGLYHNQCTLLLLMAHVGQHGTLHQSQLWQYYWQLQYYCIYGTFVMANTTACAVHRLPQASQDCVTMQINCKLKQKWELQVLGFNSHGFKLYHQLVMWHTGIFWKNNTNAPSTEMETTLIFLSERKHCCISLMTHSMCII